MHTTSHASTAPSSLEPATQQFIDSLAELPPLSAMTPEAAHKLLTDLQAKPDAKRPVEIEDAMSVRYNQTVHDFVMLNPLADTPAARGAIGQAISALRGVLHHGDAVLDPVTSSSTLMPAPLNA